MSWWMWLLLGAGLRELVHLAWSAWTVNRAARQGDGVVSDSWRTEQMTEAGKSGR